MISEQQSETYLQQMRALAAGLSVTWGVSEEDVKELLTTLLGQALANRISDPETIFWDNRKRAEQRLSFTAPPNKPPVSLY